MGRGGQSKALTAKELLFGPRRQGPGPSHQIDVRYSSWRDYLCEVVDAAAESGLIADASDTSFFGNAETEGNKRELIVISGEHSHVRLTPYEDRGHRGVGIYYFDGPFNPNDAASAATYQGIDSDLDNFDLYEERLAPYLRKRNVESIETNLDGLEVVARLAQGQNLDITSDGWAESSDDATRRYETLELVKNAHDNNHISNAELDSLTTIIASRPGDSNYLRELATSTEGATAIAASKAISVRILI